MLRKHVRVRLFLCTKNLYKSYITYDQETCTGLTLPVCKKYARNLHYLCSRKMLVSAISCVKENYIYISDTTCVQITCKSLQFPISRNLYLTAIACVHKTCMCPPLPVFKSLVRVWHYLCKRHMYVSANTCVQETCMCPSYHVFKKYVSDITCVLEMCTCLTWPVFWKHERLSHYLCSTNLHVSDITCVQETCSYLPLPVFKNMWVFAITCVQETCTCSICPVLKKHVRVRHYLFSRNMYRQRGSRI